jgi:hypothetical protein
LRSTGKDKPASRRSRRGPVVAVVKTGNAAGFIPPLTLWRPEETRILGFTVFSVHAAGIMSALQIAMIAEQLYIYTKLRDALLTHPTLMEGLIPPYLLPRRPWWHERPTREPHPERGAILGDQ